jgi:hypothetical protein
MSVELARFQGLKAAATMRKALTARILWGVEPESFLMLGMANAPSRAWRDWMSYFGELEPGLRTINWRGDGKRLTVDKLATAERLLQAAIPAAPILAVVGRDASAHPHLGQFASPASLEELTAAVASWPNQLFVKPADGWRGDGIFGPERQGDSWLVEEKRLSNRQLAKLLRSRSSGAGLLVQERLTSHPALAPIGGELELGTVRVNTALTSSGPELVFAFAKVMGSRCLVDNFSGGKFGNMLAQVDTTTGQLERVYGRNAGQQYLMTQIDRHPLTGTSFGGFQLPLWHQVADMAKAVANAFPEAPLIGSDIAITPIGPVVIEVQSDWDANGAQLMMGRGLRQVFEDLLPRLDLPDAVRQEAHEKLGLGRRRRQLRARSLREERA